MRPGLLRILAAAAAVAALLVPAAAWPQSHLRPGDPGVWKPWKGLTAIASVRADRALGAAQVKAFEAELLALNALLQRASGVAAPVGFSVETWGHVSGYRVAEHAPGQPAGGRLPVAGSLTFGAFPIFEYQRGGKTVVSDTGETALLQFAVNEIGRGLIDTGYVADWGPIDTDAFLQPQLKGEVFGLPRYGDGLIVARDPAALWTPLTLAAALDLVVVTRRIELTGAETRVALVTKQLADLRDPSRKAARAAEVQKDAATMADPAKFTAMMADVARIEEDALTAELATGGGAAKTLAAARTAFAEVNDLLGELSLEDKAGPSCHVASGATLRARFRPAPADGCVPLVRPNYAYFDPTLPRSAPQVLIITPVARCFETADPYNREANAPGPSGCAANRRLIETLDHAALRAWVR